MDTSDRGHDTAWFQAWSIRLSRRLSNSRMKSTISVCCWFCSEFISISVSWIRDRILYQVVERGFGFHESRLLCLGVGLHPYVECGVSPYEQLSKFVWSTRNTEPTSSCSQRMVWSPTMIQTMWT